MVEYACFQVHLAFDTMLKQHENNCNLLLTNTCGNNQCLFLDLECRQTSLYSTDKTFAVKGRIMLKLKTAIIEL